MASNMLLIAFIAIGCLIVAVMGLFRPFLGLLVFLAIHFAQPAELVPALAPLRIELVYGACLITILMVRRAKDPARTPLLADRILYASVLLVGAGVLSVPFSVWRGGAVETVIEMIKLITLMFLIRLLVDTDDRMRRLLWLMVLIATWIAGSTLYSFYHGMYYHLTYNMGNLNRAEGINSIVGGPNELGGFLLALLPLLIALLRTTRSFRARLLLVACGITSLMAIALTGSRIAVIGLLVIAAFYTLRSENRMLTLIGSLAIAILLWSWMPPEYRVRYLTVQEYAEGAKLDDSNQFRLQVWAAGWQIFLKYPIVGVGAGQFKTAYGVIYLAGRHMAWMQPHNLLLEIACELGLVGVGVFGIFLLQLLRGIKVALQQKANPQAKLNYQMALACSVMFVGVAILSIVGHTLYRPYWYLLGGFVAANRGIVLKKEQDAFNHPEGNPEGSTDEFCLSPKRVGPRVSGMRSFKEPDNKSGWAMEHESRNKTSPSEFLDKPPRRDPRRS
jgi:O-antigen ligase